MAQAIATYTGLTNIRGVSMTFTHGITPSTALIAVPVENVAAIANGTLTMSYGANVITFLDCALVRVSLSNSSAGNIVQLQVADRRWRWKFGNIRGAYNQKKADGTLDAATEKTPQELATLCLEAMGETGFSVHRMPNVTRPEVEWDDISPAQALATLCDDLSTRIVLNYATNAVELWPVGDGEDLPINDFAMTPGWAATSDFAPSSIRIVPGPNVYQLRFTTEAVAVEEDGEYKALEEVSYYPGSAFEVSCMNVADGDDRALARKTVYRSYRATGFHVAGEQLPGVPDETIEDVTLIDELLELDDTKQAKPAYLWGDYYDNAGAGEMAMGVRWDESHSLRGQVVTLSEPAILLDQSLPRPAELYYEATCTVRRRDDHMPHRVTFIWTPPGAPPGTQPLIVKRDDLALTWTAVYTPDGQFTTWESNADEFQAEAQKAAEEAWKRLLYRRGVDVTYEGLRTLKLDGRVNQITWTAGFNAAATTRASSGTEHSIGTPSERERRRRERLDMMAERRERRYRKNRAER